MQDRHNESFSSPLFSNNGNMKEKKIDKLRVNYINDVLYFGVSTLFLFSQVFKHFLFFIFWYLNFIFV